MSKRCSDVIFQLLSNKKRITDDCHVTYVTVV